MAPNHISQFISLLRENLHQAKAESLAARLARSEHAAALLTLLMELSDASRKVAAAAIETMPDMVEVLSDEDLVPWMDLAVSLTERSGATALKYCQESVELFRCLPATARRAALQVGLELAEQDAPMALESLRESGAVVHTSGPDALAVWAQIGADLARWDYVLGIEYFRRSPPAIAILPVEDLKTWAAVSVKLVTTNNLGKRDYLAALTYLRTSPLLLGDVEIPAVRRRLVCLISAVADSAPDRAIALLGDAPNWLRQIKIQDWQERVLQYGMLIADKDASVAHAYVTRAPEVLELIGAYDAPPPASLVERFEAWFKGGMEALDYTPEAALAYFGAETRKALEAIDAAASGVALREIVRVLKLFAEGLSGKSLTILPRDDAQSNQSSSEVTSSGEGIIRLPARLRRYPTREDNLRLYKLMVAHEAGHFEYGTYDLDVSRLSDLAAQACLRYDRPALSTLRSLDDLFRCYPHPALIKDLWALAEDARIEARLKEEYPGLRRDMEMLVREELSRRSLAHGMSVKELVVELLLQLSSASVDEVQIPVALEEVVTRAWLLLQGAVQPHTTAETVIRAVHRAYVLIEELTAPSQSVPSGERPSEDPPPVNPRAGEEQGAPYKPLANFAYRGGMDAEHVRVPEQEGERDQPEGLSAGRRADAEAPRLDTDSGQTTGSLVDAPAFGEASQDIGSVPTQRLGPVTEGGLGAGFAKKEPRVFLYDEWDGTIHDYRSQWCRVVEQEAPEGTERFVEETRSTFGGTISLLRRYFEGIRPPAFRRIRRQADGEDVDIEAAIEALVQRRAQTSPTEYVYIRRDRRQRDVAAAFLVDLSGSTGRQIGPAGTRIIDVEKEGLVLLAEALEAIGDQYALYGYSGQSRRDVQFLVLKDFEERYGSQIWRRLDAVKPMVQNRDGAAIRHTIHRLAARSARIKLMILLSDGRPLDDLYSDEYALEDTKAALREAKARGIHVFCITVDREGSGYLARMYGDVSYVIIDRVQTLPERLPRIYRILTT